MTRLFAALVSLFVGLAEICLVLRVIFRLFAANHIPFVTWVYNTSDTLLKPFRGIFEPGHISTGHVLDFTALFGMLVYAFLGVVLRSVLHALRKDKHHKEKSKK